MKRYKLLKNTPIAPKGKIFGEYVRNGDTYLIWSDRNKAKHLAELRKATIFNFDEWFKEIKEFEEWKPEEGDGYKCVSSDGIPYEATYFDDGADRHRLSIGNCYPTDTPDELIIKEQKLIPQALHRLKMAAKKAWFEFDGGEGPDWRKGSQRKHSIYYSHAGGGICLDSTWSAQEMMGVYFPTEDSAQAYIDNNLGDLKLLFGVE